MANKSYYVDQSFNTVHTASDYADIQKRLAEGTEAQDMYKQFYSAAADVNKYYDELLRTSQGTTKGGERRSMFEQKNVVGATGALGLNRYEQAVNAKFNSAFGKAVDEIQTDRAKSLATINKHAEEFESYIGESSAGLSEYIINWYQNAGVDPNTWSADFSSSSAADMLREGYVAYDTDVNSEDYGSLVVTDKWRDAMAQFFRGDYMAKEFGAEKGKAAGQTGATYRMENLRTYNKDLYDFASTYRKTYIDLESGDVQGIINKSDANVDTYADAYNTANMMKLFGSQDVPTPGLNKTYGYIKDTSKLDSEQRAAYLDKKQAVLGYVANSGLQLSDNGQRVTNFANGTKFTIDGTTFTVSEPSTSDFEFGTAGSKEYSRVAKTGEQANLRLSTRKTDWYDGTAGTTVSLGTTVNAGTIKAGDVIFVDNNYYLVTRADPDPDKKKKGGTRAADVRLTRVIPT